MAGIDLTDPQVQSYIFGAVKHAHNNNQNIRAARERAKQAEEERQRHLELLEKMQRMYEGGEVKAASVGPVAVAAVEEKEVYSQYAPDMDVSIGCIPCTTTHLQTIVSALKDAEDGHPEKFSAARKEIVALRAYDLTPEKLAATPERERVELMKLESQLAELDKQMEGPSPEATFAAASLEEAMRFARADGLDHPEAKMRTSDSEIAISSLERVTFAPAEIERMPPDRAELVWNELTKIREARQDLTNKVKTPKDLQKVTARIAIIDDKLNPPPDAETIKKLSREAQELNARFRRDVLDAFVKSRKEGSA